MDREELHRRVMLFDEYLRAGKLRFMDNVADAIAASLTRVRIAEDGLVDPGTVDARVRSLLLAVAHFHSRDQAKSAVSLREIQEGFYAGIESVFGSLHQQMIQHSATPYAVAADFASNPDRVRSVDAEVLDLLSANREFWEQYGFATWCHCEDLSSLKGIFSSSLFPETRTNIVSSCGLYVDTVCLPDPLLKISAIAKLWTPQERVREVLRFGLKLLQYRDAVLADVDPPIALILPDLSETDESYRELISSMSKNDIVKHSSVLLGRDFASVEELREYTKYLKTAQDVIRTLARPERLLFDAENASPLEEQIEEFMADEGRTLRLQAAGDVLYTQVLGRMQQANDAVHRSRRARGVPVIDAETSWTYFNWKLEYDASGSEFSGQSPLHVVRGLQRVARDRMRWIGQVPLEALLEMRRMGALDEIRSMLAAGVQDIAACEPSNFCATTNRVTCNIQQAFAEHEARIDELRKKKWKFAGHDIGSWVVVGTLEIAAALVASSSLSPVLGVGGFLAQQVLDAPKLREIPSKWRELRRAGARLRESATGLLFKHSA